MPTKIAAIPNARASPPRRSSPSLHSDEDTSPPGLEPRMTSTFEERSLSWARDRQVHNEHRPDIYTMGASPTYTRWARALLVGREARNLLAHNERLHGIGPFVGVHGLDVSEVARDVVFQQDAHPAEHVAGIGGNAASSAGVV